MTQKAVATHLKTIHGVLSDPTRPDNAIFMRVAHPYPTSEFPWFQQNITGELLRKRLEPNITTWAFEARKSGVKLGNGTQDMSKEDWHELWNWAAPDANGIAREIFEDDEEGQSPTPGQSPTASEGGGGEAMEGVEKVSDETIAPMMNLGDLMRFTSTGSIPPPKPTFTAPR